MKKCFQIIAALAVILGLSLTVVAAELTGCGISADSVSGEPGELVEVPVRVTGNPGFTNFGIALDYDREKLTLVEIRLENGKDPHLCGDFAASGLEWSPAKDVNGAQNPAFSRDRLYGYVVCARPAVVREDGVLFTAVFKLADSFTGTASVTPVVNYMRNNGAIFSVFETVVTHCEPGTVSGDGSSVLMGDVNQDGFITADDAATAFAASKGAVTLTEKQLAAADANGDGYITADDAAQIFAMSKSNQ